MITILDGGVGSELDRRGVPTPAPIWSAAAIESAPEVLAAIHRDYAEAGAVVHTAATFRTTRRAAGARWESWARRAVAIARASVPGGHRIAGSIAPLEDCYRPDLSPPNPGPEHALLAEVLADAGCDVILCEAFPHVREAIAAVDAAVATGAQTWCSFTGGPEGTLLTPRQIAEAAREAESHGARAVFVNCIASELTLPYVEALASAKLPAPIGVYANTWTGGAGPERYAQLARAWRDAGATLIGGCCGTTPDHIRALARSFRRSEGEDRAG